MYIGPIDNYNSDEDEETSEEFKEKEKKNKMVKTHFADLIPDEQQHNSNNDDDNEDDNDGLIKREINNKVNIMLTFLIIIIMKH